MDFSLLGFRGLHEVFNVHPVFVHFPLALFPSAFFLYGLGVSLNWRAATVAGRACLYLATASTVIAIITGLMAQNIPHNDRIHRLMMTHRQIGLAIGPLSLLLMGWSFFHTAQRPKAAYLFLLVLGVTTLAVLQNGDLGARMVFVEGAAVKPAVSVITGSQEEAQPHSHGATEEGAPTHHH